MCGRLLKNIGQCPAGLTIFDNISKEKDNECGTVISLDGRQINTLKRILREAGEIA